MPERRSKRPTKTSRKSRASAAVAVEEARVPDVAEVVEQPRSSVATAASAVSIPVTSEIQSILDSVTDSSSEIETRFAEVFAILDRELSASREDKNRKVNLRTWKALIKSVNKARNTSLRASRKKRRAVNNENAGFNKPVKVSEELAKFAGWKAGELHSRVEVTRLICNYVKENNLQNPEARKEIIPDKKLRKLLQYKDGDVLTFTSLQTPIQRHFIKE